ncbi:MAG: S8 family peptidase, partial [Vicinamibacteria bacterium]
AGVTVAVLDTGIDAQHEAFRGKTIVQKDFTGEGDGDGNGHGTHCAGTVFGGEVAGQRIGVAPGVGRALIGKVLNRRGSGSTEQLLDGVLWAAREGANVISMSIGLDFPGLVKRLIDSGLQVEPATSKALAAYRDNVRLFDKLAELLSAQSAMLSKTMIVAAGGNESRRPAFEIATAPPAAADGIVAVGAVGRTGDALTDLRIATFSNTGPDIAAPGVGVVSAKVGGGVRALDGTSMATPHVAGVTALWIEKIQERNPSFKMSEIEGRLVGQATSAMMAADEDPADLGAGLVQAPRN